MKLRFWLSAIPDYARLPLVFVVIWNQAVYCGSKLLAAGWSHYDLTTAFDRATPFLPWTVSVYLASCVFWVLCYIYCASQEKRQAYRFLCADFLAKAVCLVFFLLLPTTNVRPAIEGSSLWCVFMRILYQMDSPTNLFPSIHCLVSWLCFLGVRDAPHAESVTIWRLLRGRCHLPLYLDDQAARYRGCAGRCAFGPDQLLGSEQSPGFVSLLPTG